MPSPKTEHIEGREFRVIPLFPELRGPLLEVFQQADEGAVHVITRHRGENMNLRTQFKRILERASVTPWPKLFHNLRSSRQTELAQTLPGFVVCNWLGNTEPVARQHYYQITDAHFTEALEDAPPAKEARNQAQHTPAQTRTGEKMDDPTNETRPVFPGDALACASVQSSEWPLSGVNNPPDSGHKSQISPERGAKSGANGATSGDDPDLAELLTAWPKLSPVNRRAMLAIVRGAVGNANGSNAGGRSSPG